MAIWNIWLTLWIFLTTCFHFVYISFGFGIICGEKSGNPDVAAAGVR
jgi:hypothetical protein